MIFFENKFANKLFLFDVTYLLPNFGVFCNNSLFLISKGMYLVSSNLLTCPFIYENLMHNGFISCDFSFFIFVIGKCFRYYVFIDIYIMYVYWNFGGIKLLLLIFITTGFKNCFKMFYKESKIFSL